MDRDSVRAKGSASRLLKRFGAGELDILVGTQMITKGYDFPRVTLVGVIAADASLGFPDFRAAERTFQLLCQVGGRAGRGERPGRVLVQTLNPDHYSIRAARENDYPSFFRQETLLREQLGYPPFSYLARLMVQGGREKSTEQGARRLGKELESVRQDLQPNNKYPVRILGPVEAPIARIKGRYRWQMLIKCPSGEALHYILNQIEGRCEGLERRYAVRIVTDVDPYQML
jgi:primosomal protein N' (replication factor Y)